jgi:hypothetical protein
MIPDINKGIVDAGKIVDDVITTDEEASAEATKRLISDNSSGSWIPKAIRPFLAVYYSGLYGALLFFGLKSGAVDLQTAVLSTAAIATSIVSFYFVGRNKLKVVEMQTKSAIRITEIRAKAEVKEDRKTKRAERKAARRESRN